VKYHVYLGLACEELCKRSSSDKLRQEWFLLAEQEYLRSVELNPRNSYYSGNLGRLYGMGVEAGQAQYLEQAEKYYQQAIALAPVTVLFYQNLIQLYAHAGMPEKALALAQGLEAREQRQAGYIYYVAGSSLFEWSRTLEQKKDHGPAKALAQQALQAFEKAEKLRPDLPEIPHNHGIACLMLGQKEMARALFAQALAIDPNTSPPSPC